MSGPPDPDPAAHGPGSLLGASFWALIAFGVICVLAGAGLWALAPRRLTPHPAPGPPGAAAAPPRPTALGERPQSR